jgi:peptidoglycan/LPS O-acetylase OafA/YrhL
VIFKGLEGLRAWLAWAVVFSHTAMLSGLSTIFPISEIFIRAGDYSVRVFIVLSGFVITNLIIGKAEAYQIYLIRRFLRIFPAYLIALVFSIFTADIAFRAVLDFPYTLAFETEFFTIQQQQFHQNFWSHLVAHLTLLHGIFPENILPQSQYIFVAPAWSLSLEWQFYLIAPIWIWALRRFPFLTVTASFVGMAIYQVYIDKLFFSPSFLPGASLWFLLGIGTRLLIPLAPRLTHYPYLAVYCTLGFVFFKPQLLVFSIWVAMVAYLLQGMEWKAFDSQFVKKAGERSYAVYIIHFPIVLLSLYFATKIFHLALYAAIPAIFAMTTLGTLAAAELIFRFVETPAINFGRLLGRRTTSLATSIHKI